MWTFIIAIIAFVIVIVLKNKNNTAPTKSNSNSKGLDVSEQINSEYRMKYGPSYDCVYNYNDTIARWIALKEVPKYAMDWLAESI